MLFFFATATERSSSDFNSGSCRIYNEFFRNLDANIPQPMVTDRYYPNKPLKF
jgi:hypothetical protein